MKVGNKVLGCAIGQRSILLAEVAQRGGKPAVQHYAEFVFPEGLSLATDAVKLGEAMAQFLRTRKFSTREVVVGLPAKRLVTRRKEVPPASPAVAANMLRLQAEGDFSSELDNLVMDYAGTSSTAETTTVLLVATNRDILEQCEAFARAAGLKILAITATSAALGRATSRLPGGDGLVLNLGQSGSELVVQHGQDPAHLRHLNTVGASSPESIGALAGEIRRIIAAIPRNGTPQTLALWKDPSLADQSDTGALLEARLAMPVSTPELRSLLTTDNRDANAYAAPVALALSAMEPAGLPVDFLHSRLTPPAPPLISPMAQGIILIVVLVVGLIGWAFYDLGRKQQERDQLVQIINTKKSAVDDATLWKNRVLDANNRLPLGVYFVKAWRDVSDYFPRQGGTIWATHLSSNINDRSAWVLEGKSINETEAYSLAARMVPPRGSLDYGTTPFATAEISTLREDTNARGQQTFTLRFTYK